MEEPLEVLTVVGDGVREARVRRLVAELQSGRYTQTTGRLEREGEKDGFCCLGVACHVAMEMGLELTREPPTLGGESVWYGMGEQGSTSTLPAAVMGWYGFALDDPRLQVPQSMLEHVDGELANLWSCDGALAASVLNDRFHLSLGQTGECFQYTFLRGDWEAAHGASDA